MLKNKEVIIMERTVVYIDHNMCVSCGCCVDSCPNNVIQTNDLVSHPFTEYNGKCLDCKEKPCVGSCPMGAVVDVSFKM